MSLSFLLLRTVNATVNVFTMKMNYSEPKIYTGGVDISTWSKLTLQEKKKAMSKDWFVYFSFRNPETGKLVKQNFIKAGANKLKTKKDRYAFLKTMQQSLLELLQYGFNPYEDNSALEEAIFSDATQKSKNKATEKQQESNSKAIEQQQPTIKETNATSILSAFEFTLDLKANMMNKNSFVQYKSRIGLFEKWLKEKTYFDNPITFITKKIIIEYLNDVLKRTSARNRNNSRTDIASMFQLLEDNEIVKENFVRKIAVLKTVPKRNKTYTPKQEKDIYEYMKSEDPHLLLFVKFISYSILRPIEICRLKIADIDVIDKKIYVKAKNKPVQIKRLPTILLDSLPDLSLKDPKAFLFGRFEIGEDWDAEETNKRNEFSKRFKKIKEHFKLGTEFGMYSFKHTFITKMYNSYRNQGKSQHEARSMLMPITGHSTMVALEKYLRDIDAELPDDYSVLLRK
ncbi:tyrosine-type recombinase/integrase [Polaribacter pectinis]|uniref:Tyrosine-type recombinase/integrase n=1 Tax=Polaribacter pectinis TaxID=2738844 RepID=A0A7G9L7N8_9FLAO|nr:tyrosine-type recombinase/integrase [Polaribacter pectinis]QNM84551.1 tyrosine-type recombinase/integrase [Polaribacter pectinis]QNM84637.1 tyrosine-type recombinase/integrase [Polaribacter pectinis]